MDTGPGCAHFIRGGAHQNAFFRGEAMYRNTLRRIRRGAAENIYILSVNSAEGNFLQGKNGGAGAKKFGAMCGSPVA